MFLSDSSLETDLWYSVEASSIRRAFSPDLSLHSLAFAKRADSFSFKPAISSLTALSFLLASSNISSSPASLVFLSKRRLVSSAFLILICSSIVAKRCFLDWILPRSWSRAISSFLPFSSPSLQRLTSASTASCSFTARSSFSLICSISASSAAFLSSYSFLLLRRCAFSFSIAKSRDCKCSSVISAVWICSFKSSIWFSSFCLVDEVLVMLSRRDSIRSSICCISFPNPSYSALMLSYVALVSFSSSSAIAYFSSADLSSVSMRADSSKNMLTS